MVLTDIEQVYSSAVSGAKFQTFFSLIFSPAMRFAISVFFNLAPWLWETGQKKPFIHSYTSMSFLLFIPIRLGPKLYRVSEQYNYATRIASLHHLNPKYFKINTRENFVQPLLDDIMGMTFLYLYNNKNNNNFITKRLTYNASKKENIIKTENW